jgi:hypothetical protein
MPLRALMVVVHPCVLCEGDLAEQTLWRDDETGYEEWSVIKALPHSCDEFRRLRGERIPPPRQRLP